MSLLCVSLFAIITTVLLRASGKFGLPSFDLRGCALQDDRKDERPAWNDDRGCALSAQHQARREASVLDFRGCALQHGGRRERPARRDRRGCALKSQTVASCWSAAAPCDKAQLARREASIKRISRLRLAARLARREARTQHKMNLAAEPKVQTRAQHNTTFAAAPRESSVSRLLRLRLAPRLARRETRPQHQTTFAAAIHEPTASRLLLSRLAARPSRRGTRTKRLLRLRLASQA